MPDSTHYLIDYENVNNDGLSGAEELGGNDFVYIFSTRHAAKITFEMLSTFNSTSLKVYNVPARKQSVDMHLVSYLGSLIGKYGENANYIIVSKDTDYDNIIAFWKKQNNVEISRRSSITETVKPLPKTKAKETKQKEVKEKYKTAPNPVQTLAPKSILNNLIQKATIAAGYEHQVSNSVASAVCSLYGTDDFSERVKEELESNFADYPNAYDIIADIIENYETEEIQTPDTNPEVEETSAEDDTAKEGEAANDTTEEKPQKRQYKKKTQPPVQNSSTQLNNEVQKLLSDAKLDTEIIAFTASLISKSHTEKNGKRIIYRALISKYGMKQGVIIYNLIKAVL